MNVPDHGWTLANVEDLWEAVYECDHCHNERIRYIHHLHHPNRQPIRVGCVRAVKLSGDGTGPP